MTGDSFYRAVEHSKPLVPRVPGYLKGSVVQFTCPRCQKRTGTPLPSDTTAAMSIRAVTKCCRVPVTVWIAGVLL